MIDRKYRNPSKPEGGWTDWEMHEEETIQVEIWIATPPEGSSAHVEMMQALGDYVDRIGLCVTATRGYFRYTGGTEPGLSIGLRNYPRFPSDWEELIGHAEKIGFAMAEAGDQGSFMVVDHDGSTYWFTRRGDAPDA